MFSAKWNIFDDWTLHSFSPPERISWNKFCSPTWHDICMFQQDVFTVNWVSTLSSAVAEEAPDVGTSQHESFWMPLVEKVNDDTSGLQNMLRIPEPGLGLWWFVVIPRVWMCFNQQLLQDSATIHWSTVFWIEWTWLHGMNGGMSWQSLGTLVFTLGTVMQIRSD